MDFVSCGKYEKIGEKARKLANDCKTIARKIFMLFVFSRFFYWLTCRHEPKLIILTICWHQILFFVEFIALEKVGIFPQQHKYAFCKWWWRKTVFLKFWLGPNLGNCVSWPNQVIYARPKLFHNGAFKCEICWKWKCFGTNLSVRKFKEIVTRNFVSGSFMS